MSDREPAAAPVRPPRAVAWVLVLASAAAVALVGLAGTAAILSRSAWSDSIPRGFWLRLAIAAALTVASLELRTLRWIFLLRRAETRIPIRDAYIGYLSGLSLLFAPLLVGEAGVRAWVQRSRAGVPIGTTIAVNLWERLLDLAALAVIAGGAGALMLGANARNVGALVFAAVLLARPVRLIAAGLAGGVGAFAGRRLAAETIPPHVEGLTHGGAWLVALAASVAAWILPGVGFWWIARAWPGAPGAVRAIAAYASSAGRGGLVLAPGGVGVAGERLLGTLAAAGVPDGAAALAVFSTRLATLGVATALGAVFLLIHRRTAPAATVTHFDDIAAAYDVQIPEARRLSLLGLKARLMRDALGAGARRGLDVGCGQGAYVGEMRRLGFDVTGIDESAGQIAIAACRLGRSDLVSNGSALHIPADDGAYDFVYTINVLHHLPSIEDQRRAVAEIFRVLRPGGVLFVHEINTRNVLFRFYMGYVFPSLNCIDEGVERWLRPDRLSLYTDVPVAEIRYFTFLPEFLPAPLVRLLAPLERLLEGSPLRPFSAHYMAILRKPE